jgi:rfaE bifunctional protein nucleotidyltransferase chain/domain
MHRQIKRSTDRKILCLEDLIQKVEELKAKGKTVVQTHGVFDIIHPGIIQHITSAKSLGSLLIVTVIKDKDVRRGPGRPVFSEKLRAENVSNLEPVDYVCAVDDGVPFECIRQIKPDIFAKGQSYSERDKKIHDKIFKEERELYFGKIKILETSGFSFSSSKIINNFLDIYPEDTKQYLREFSLRYSFGSIAENINSLKKLKVLIIGDGIIDEYHYCSPMGKAAKAQLVVNKFLTYERFAGGAFAIANHMAGICDNVTLVTLLGADDSHEAFITRNLKPGIQTKYFIRDDGPTVVKKRYVDWYNNQKLFEVNYLNDLYITGDCESEIIKYLSSAIPEYDLVAACDFGHGFISRGVIGVMDKLSNILAVNTQTNAANTGFNLITKYRRSDFVCLDEPEARLAIQNKFDDAREVADELIHRLGSEKLIVTLGKKGAYGIDKFGNTHQAPIFSSKVIDTVGAGDAFFAYTAPCFAMKMPLDFITFIGNVVGAIAVQIIGNKRAVEKYEILEFIHSLLKN